MRYGQPFTINTPDAANITKVALIRPAAVTHSFDMEQRYLQLHILDRPGGTSVRVAAPAHENIAPQGYYMLFVLRSHAQGPIPSEAKFVRLER